MRPLILAPDNFTPPTRTPWGGRRLIERYKAAVIRDLSGVVGESWEVSIDPAFPSRTADGRTLRSVVSEDPSGWLGSEVAARYGQLPLLVKLLDAATELSLQVHPTDDDPNLGPGEGGKPEAWWILEADEGAGIYLGFRDGVDRRAVEGCLRSHGNLDELMNFVPVSSGDVFSIPAGTAHAIGGGVTLLEPQWVLPGRTGVTYRYWDWNRRYDERGLPSSTGSLRPLHVERSLDVTRWSETGARCVDRCRVAIRTETSTNLQVSSTDAQIPFCSIARVIGTGAWRRDVSSFSALVVLEGSADIRTLVGSSTHRVTVGAGQTLVVPAVADAIELDVDSARLFVVSAVDPNAGEADP